MEVTVAILIAVVTLPAIIIFVFVMGVVGIISCIYSIGKCLIECHSFKSKIGTA